MYSSRKAIGTVNFLRLLGQYHGGGFTLSSFDFRLFNNSDLSTYIFKMITSNNAFKITNNLLLIGITFHNKYQPTAEYICRL